jgi:hypothetical protein
MQNGTNQVTMTWLVPPPLHDMPTAAWAGMPLAVLKVGGGGVGGGRGQLPEAFLFDMFLTKQTTHQHHARSPFASQK